MNTRGSATKSRGNKRSRFRSAIAYLWDVASKFPFEFRADWRLNSESQLGRIGREAEHLRRDRGAVLPLIGRLHNRSERPPSFPCGATGRADR